MKDEDKAPLYGDCEHCGEADRKLWQIDEDEEDSPWVCEMCLNTLDGDFRLPKDLDE